MVTDDVDGALFSSKLLDQELVKYPPSRRLADSALLRREHWWWLPCVVVQLRRRTRTEELPARDQAARAEGLLVRSEPAGLRLDVVGSGDWDGDPLRLRTADPVRGDGSPALVFGHDYSQPDLERWEVWSRRGPLRGPDLTVEERTGTPGVPLSPLDLRTRLRTHRELERDCRRGIEASERLLRGSGVCGVQTEPSRSRASARTSARRPQGSAAAPRRIRMMGRPQRPPPRGWVRFKWGVERSDRLVGQGHSNAARRAREPVRRGSDAFRCRASSGFPLPRPCGAATLL